MDPTAQIITAIGTLVAAVVAGIVAIAGMVIQLRASRKVNAVSSKLDTVEQKQDVQHVATNSRLDQLLATTAREKLAEGKVAGLAEAAAVSAGIAAAISNPDMRRDTTSPLPVTDDRTARATEQVAEAMKDSAVATQRIATAAEKPKA